MLLMCALLAPAAVANGQEKAVRPLIISYASVSGTRGPLWIAKDLGLFQKYGLDANLIYIASGVTSVSALLGGSVHVIAASGSSAVAAAVRGASVVIIASQGAIGYKLIAHPSITSIQGLKGKVIGSSRLGAGSDYAIRRLLPKLGLDPAKDVKLLATGLSESDRRLMVMMQGKIDATIGTVDNILQMELRGQKVSVLADFLEYGVYTTGSDIATSRELLKERRQDLKAFIMALTEGTAIGRKDKEQTFRVYRKYMHVEEAARLESMYKNYMLGSIPAKPYPRAEAIQNDIDDLSDSYPQLKGRKVAEFVDLALLQELEKEGFFTRVYAR
jgi:ABC-type nitrate/sulfonate/bicarbonate transport system substrate-binding protein